MTIDEIKKWMLESSGFPVTQANAEYLERFQAIAFQAGAASRDAEIHHLQMALADTEALELGTAEKCDKLREQVAILREALLTCSVGDFSTGHVIYPSFDEKLVEEALAATEPKIAKPT